LLSFLLSFFLSFFLLYLFLSSSSSNFLNSREKRKATNWQIAFGEIEMKEEIGRGASGVVNRALWKGSEVAGEW
jgi:hypothetical protein